MNRLALALAMLASPALACDACYSPPKRMSLEPGDGQPCLWTVVIENRLGTYNAVETLDTDRGEIRVRYETRGTHGPGADDFVEVVKVPEGLTAYPWEMDLADDATGRVCVMEDRGM